MQENQAQVTSKISDSLQGLITDVCGPVVPRSKDLPSVIQYSRYKDQPDALGSGFMFSWNPCTPFDELTDCKQVSVSTVICPSKFRVLNYSF